MEITPTKIILRKILVLSTANMSSPFEIFTANTCVVMRIDTTKIRNISIEKNPIVDVIIKNQNEKPAVTASDLNRGDDVSIYIGQINATSPDWARAVTPISAISKMIIGNMWNFLL